MNMSLYELYTWWLGVDLPGIAAIWTWLITVPWWLAILTVVLIRFSVGIVWSLARDFSVWLSGWMFDAGAWIGQWIPWRQNGIKLRFVRMWGKYTINQ